MQLSEWGNKRVDELSKGMAQKIQFITTVIHKPELIILDEPFSGLDPINMTLLKDLMLELREERQYNYLLNPCDGTGGETM